MKRIDWNQLDAAGRKAALARPQRRTEGFVASVVREIFDDVQARGGEAVIDWATRLDGAPPRRIEITEAAATKARRDLPPAAARALRVAADNVRVFHQATKPEDTPLIETTPGVKSRLVWLPIGSAGLYVPGGTAPLFSSLLMLAIPAGVAGVGRRVAVTPPSKDGSVHPAMIAAAAEAGLDELWLLGGAQAIAALTFGAELEDGIIAPVDKLFGPGNAYVAEAKRYASALPGGPAQDLPAGPSELPPITRFCPVVLITKPSSSKALGRMDGLNPAGTFTPSFAAAAVCPTRIETGCVIAPPSLTIGSFAPLIFSTYF